MADDRLDVICNDIKNKLDNLIEIVQERGIWWI